MEWITSGKDIQAVFKKYRYVGLILLAGIVLMLLPTGVSGPREQPAQPVQSDVTVQESLKAILEQVAGAGRVEVLLSEDCSAETVYQVNENHSSADDREELRRETVLVSGETREKTGLARKVQAPVYRGAVVVCQGADSAAVRLAVVQAVKSATGLSADCISVLKMK